MTEYNRFNEALNKFNKKLDNYHQEMMKYENLLKCYGTMKITAKQLIMKKKSTKTNISHTSKKNKTPKTRKSKKAPATSKSRRPVVKKPLAAFSKQERTFKNHNEVLILPDASLGRTTPVKLRLRSATQLPKHFKTKVSYDRYFEMRKQAKSAASTLSIPTIFPVGNNEHALSIAHSSRGTPGDSSTDTSSTSTISSESTNESENPICVSVDAITTMLSQKINPPAAVPDTVHPTENLPSDYRPAKPISEASKEPVVNKNEQRKDLETGIPLKEDETRPKPKESSPSKISEKKTFSWNCMKGHLGPSIASSIRPSTTMFDSTASTGVTSGSKSTVSQSSLVSTSPTVTLTHSGLSVPSTGCGNVGNSSMTSKANHDTKGGLFLSYKPRPSTEASLVRPSTQDTQVFGNLTENRPRLIQNSGHEFGRVNPLNQVLFSSNIKGTDKLHKDKS